MSLQLPQNRTALSQPEKPLLWHDLFLKTDQENICILSISRVSLWSLTSISGLWVTLWIISTSLSVLVWLGHLLLFLCFRSCHFGRVKVSAQLSLISLTVVEAVVPSVLYLPFHSRLQKRSGLSWMLALLLTFVVLSGHAVDHLVLAHSLFCLPKLRGFFLVAGPLCWPVGSPLSSGVACALHTNHSYLRTVQRW